MSDKVIQLTNFTNHSVRNSNFTAVATVKTVKTFSHTALSQFYLETPVPDEKRKNIEPCTGTKLERTLSITQSVYYLFMTNKSQI